MSEKVAPAEDGLGSVAKNTRTYDARIRVLFEGPETLAYSDVPYLIGEAYLLRGASIMSIDGKEPPSPVDPQDTERRQEAVLKALEELDAEYESMEEMRWDSHTQGKRDGIDLAVSKIREALEGRKQ